MSPSVWDVMADEQRITDSVLPQHDAPRLTGRTGAASFSISATPASRICEQLHDVIDGKLFFDQYTVDAMCMRALLMIGSIQRYFYDERPNDKASLLRDLRGVLDELEESTFRDPKIRSFFEETIRYLEKVSTLDTIQRSEWEHEELSEIARRIPTMLCQETRGYYKWLARTFEGPGDIVELGSWMGSSTACLAEGLSQNQGRQGKTIHVFDSFIWLEWMKTYTEDSELLAANIRNGESFLEYFWRYTGPYRDLIQVHQAALKTETKQFAVPALSWEAGEIGILLMDFAHDMASNEAMWRVFSPSFCSGSTIVVFNQFGNIPAGEVREFCRRKGPELIPLHKPCSSAKAFRYQSVAQ